MHEQCLDPTPGCQAAFDRLSCPRHRESEDVAARQQFYLLVSGVLGSASRPRRGGNYTQSNIFPPPFVGIGLKNFPQRGTSTASDCNTVGHRSLALQLS